MQRAIIETFTLFTEHQPTRQDINSGHDAVSRAHCTMGMGLSDVMRCCDREAILHGHDDDDDNDNEVSGSHAMQLDVQSRPQCSASVHT